MKRYLKELVLLLAVFGGLPFDVASDTAYAQTAPLRVNGVKFGPNDLSVFVAPYGAIGNDTHDDTTAIQAAITAAAVSGGTVYIPAGTYKVTGTISVSSASNVHIVGVGPATYIHAVGVTQNVFSVSSCTSCSIESLRIGGAMAQGVLVVGSTQTLLRDLDISGATVLGSVDTGAIMVSNSTGGIVIERVYAHGNGVTANPSVGVDIGTYGGSTANSNITIKKSRCTSTLVHANIGLFNTTHSIVEGNITTGAILNTGTTIAGGYGIMLYQTDPANDNSQNRIVNNDVGTTQGSGIYLQCSANSVVADNRITGSATAQTDGSLQVGGIAIGHCDTISTDPTLVTGVVVSNNTISNSTLSGISAGGFYNVISGNHVDNSASTGILLRDFHHGSVVGNTLYNNTQGGIETLSARNGADADVLDSTYIGGNSISKTGGASPGIWLRNASSCTVTANTIDLAGGEGIQIYNGSDNSVSHNPITNASQLGDNSKDCILLNNTTFNRVIGNTCDGTRHHLGLEETGTSDSNGFDQNMLRNGHGTYTLLGANSVIYHQTAGGSTITGVTTFSGANGVVVNPGGSSTVRPSTDNAGSLGATTNRWAAVSSYWYDNKVGAQLTAASTITPTASIHHVTGATTITIIALTNVPSSTNVYITLIADSVVNLGTSASAGGIKIAPTALASGKAMTFVLDTATSLWYPIQGG